MNYRLYQPGDFAALYAIEEACFQPPLRFGRRYMRTLVQSESAATWVAEDAGKLAGFAIVDWTREEVAVVAYIQTLEVAPGQRRRGIGAELLRSLEASARRAGAALLWLHVDAENAPAIRLYSAEGYEERGREEHYYGRHRSAAVYVKPLEPGNA